MAKAGTLAGTLTGALRGFLAACFLTVAAIAPAAAQGLIRDAEIEAILREYSDPLFEAAGLTPSDVDIFLINDPSMNAFVAGGANVHIHTGLIIAADNPEQLKGVIAHETCHIACGHQITRTEAFSAGSNMSLISMGLGVLAIAAGAPDAGMALIASGPQFGMLTIFKHTRTEESAADQQGVKYMAATGQSSEGLVQFFDKFRYQELMSAGRQDPYFRSHPISSDRVAALRKRVEESKGQTHPQSERAIRQFDIMKAKLIGFLQSPARVAAKYPKTDLSIPARYARAIAAYRAVDIKAAMTETDGLIELEPDNPYFHELKGQILFENGKIEESVAPHRRSVELAPDQPLLKVNLARSLTELDTPEALTEAEGLLIDSIAQERDNAFAWNQIARVYGKQGRIGDADLATAEEAYLIGDMRRANNFAVRASKKLDSGTPNGRRASDISAITDPRATGRGRG
jgi:predicted Zn-dependent protease